MVVSTEHAEEGEFRSILEKTLNTILRKKADSSSVSLCNEALSAMPSTLVMAPPSIVTVLVLRFFSREYCTLTTVSLDEEDEPRW
uniref:Uncharacterized protein n=1 Tax=Romanomermis culicivorax TaxID=13658 RepID=A0A915J2J6_ROMCU